LRVQVTVLLLAGNPPEASHLLRVTAEAAKMAAASLMASTSEGETCFETGFWVATAKVGHT
jgi:hypothetical protein